MNQQIGQREKFGICMVYFLPIIRILEELLPIMDLRAIP